MGHIVTGVSVTTIASGIVCDVEIHDNGHTKPAEVVTPALASKTGRGPNAICASTLNIAVVSPSDDEYQVAGRTFSTFSDAVEAAILAADSVKAQWSADNKVTIGPPQSPDADDDVDLGHAIQAVLGGLDEIGLAAVDMAIGIAASAAELKPPRTRYARHVRDLRVLTTALACQMTKGERLHLLGELAKAIKTVTREEGGTATE